MHLVPNFRRQHAFCHLSSAFNHASVDSSLGTSGPPGFCEGESLDAQDLISALRQVSSTGAWTWACGTTKVAPTSPEGASSGLGEVPEVRMNFRGLLPGTCRVLSAGRSTTKSASHEDAVVCARNAWVCRAAAAPVRVSAAAILRAFIGVHKTVTALGPFERNPRTAFIHGEEKLSIELSGFPFQAAGNHLDARLGQFRQPPASHDWVGVFGATTTRPTPRDVNKSAQGGVFRGGCTARGSRRLWHARGPRHVQSY